MLYVKHAVSMVEEQKPHQGVAHLYQELHETTAFTSTTNILVYQYISNITIANRSITNTTTTTNIMF